MQGIIEEETSKMLKAEANEIIKEEKVSKPSYTIAGVEYDTATGLPYTYVDASGNKYTSEDLRSESKILSEDTVDSDEGTFTEGGTYIPPGFEGATTIDGESPT